jgi:hypothetical protein
VTIPRIIWKLRAVFHTSEQTILSIQFLSVYFACFATKNNVYILNINSHVVRPVLDICLETVLSSHMSVLMPDFGQALLPSVLAHSSSTTPSNHNNNSLNDSFSTTTSSFSTLSSPSLRPTSMIQHQTTPTVIQQHQTTPTVANYNSPLPMSPPLALVGSPNNALSGPRSIFFVKHNLIQIFCKTGLANQSLPLTIQRYLVFFHQDSNTYDISLTILVLLIVTHTTKRPSHHNNQLSTITAYFLAIITVITIYHYKKHYNRYIGARYHN